MPFCGLYRVQTPEFELFPAAGIRMAYKEPSLRFNTWLHAARLTDPYGKRRMHIASLNWAIKAQAPPA
jgi:hypothetical protein